MMPCRNTDFGIEPKILFEILHRKVMVKGVIRTWLLTLLMK